MGHTFLFLLHTLQFFKKWDFKTYVLTILENRFYPHHRIYYCYLFLLFVCLVTFLNLFYHVCMYCHMWSLKSAWVCLVSLWFDRGFFMFETNKSSDFVVGVHAMLRYVVYSSVIFTFWLCWASSVQARDESLGLSWVFLNCYVSSWPLLAIIMFLTILQNFNSPYGISILKLFIGFGLDALSQSLSVYQSAMMLKKKLVLIFV